MNGHEGPKSLDMGVYLVASYHHDYLCQSLEALGDDPNLYPGYHQQFQPHFAYFRMAQASANQLRCIIRVISSFS